MYGEAETIRTRFYVNDHRMSPFTRFVSFDIERQRKNSPSSLPFSYIVESRTS